MLAKTLTASLLALPLVASADTPSTTHEPVVVSSTETQFTQTSEPRQKTSAGVTLQPTEQPSNETSSGRWAEKNAALQQAPSSQTQRSEIRTHSTDFWIYDAWTSLDVDVDLDGYYHQFTVEFDADTVYASAWVYARIYLGRGDIFDEIYTTSVFMINGEDSDDSLVIENELISGFPSDEYEVLIELYDADYDDLVAITDGYSDADLSFLSLESVNYEQVIVETPVVIVEEHGGSAGLGLLGLSALVWWRRKLQGS